MNSSSVTKETKYRSLDDRICAHALYIRKVRIFFMREALAANADVSFFELFAITSIKNLDAYH